MFTAEQINSFASPGSFQKGEELVADGSVRSSSWQGGSGATGSVAGSSSTPYRITITADGTANCSCPDRRGGWCKHAVAVYLRLIGHNPGAKKAALKKAAPARAVRAAPPRRSTTRRTYYREEESEEEEEESEEEEEEESQDWEEEESEEEESEDEVPVFQPTPKNKTAAAKRPTGLANFARQPAQHLQPFGMPQPQPVTQAFTAAPTITAGPLPPFLNAQAGFGGSGCSECGRGRGVYSCQACSRFSLCADCGLLGRQYHHTALNGIQHLFNGTA